MQTHFVNLVTERFGHQKHALHHQHAVVLWQNHCVNILVFVNFGLKGPFSYDFKEILQIFFCSFSLDKESLVDVPVVEEEGGVFATVGTHVKG